ncbi:MAG TPA: AzlD domain-containing protein, partial [Miltoncostaeaceae bacterium]|nr:AzlD domain-containing protein [Miltoncostaeaceae bacterium]
IWVAVGLLALGTYGLKAAGPLLLGGRALPAALGTPLAYVAPAMLAALVAVQTLADGDRLTADARVAGTAVALVAVLARLPFLVVVLAAAGATAGLRALGAG